MSRPGPRGTSCLTCKQRHKKCDKRLPVCERCENDGYDCLGYEHNANARSRGDSVRPKLCRILPKPPEVGRTGVLGDARGSPFQQIVPKVATTSSPNLANPDHIKIGNTTRHLPLAESLISAFQRLYLELPRSSFDPLKVLLTSPSFDDQILVQYGKLMDQWYFKPANLPNQRVRPDIVFLLQESLAWVPRWIALIAMGICQAFATGDTSQNQLHSVWIGYIENFLKQELSCGTNPGEVQARRRDWVYVSLLRASLIQNSGVYQVLRNITPSLLQLAFSDPTLWPSGSDITYIPLMNILTFGSHELAYFALIDCTSAMAFGLPQLVEYDTTIHATPSFATSHQWAHGSPTEFQVVLASINACRDRTPSARDWREIERWLLAWQPRSSEQMFTESWMTVAWYAVQESWRLALLAYLYLAVCKVASDDPRIQSCVKQLFQVLGTVKNRKSSSVEVSFIVQYLIAGICARSEGQRRIVRSALGKSNEPRLWIIRGPDFVPVLDHLWHEFVVDGRPAKWSDYMRSRQVMLPIAL